MDLLLTNNENKKSGNFHENQVFQQLFEKYGSGEIMEKTSLYSCIRHSRGNLFYIPTNRYMPEMKKNYGSVDIIRIWIRGHNQKIMTSRIVILPCDTPH